MMQPTNSANPPPMGQIPMDPQQQYQHQYQQSQPPQQWMTMQAAHQQPPPHQSFQPQHPPMWGQQPQQGSIPPPQQVQQMQSQMAQQQQYGAAVSQQSATDEVKSLWIGDLQYWMDESYIWGCFMHTGEITNVKVIRNRQTTQPEGYGFIEFANRAAAEKILQTYNGTQMPNSEQLFRLNWASLGAGERRDDTPDFTLFVGDLAADVNDFLLQETFKTNYSSVRGAKVVTDRMTGRSKGYGFVKFADENEQRRAMTEMNGVLCSTRPMRVGAAATKKPAGGQQYQRASYQTSQGSDGETDLNNTTIFVGGLDENVSDDHLRQVFGQFGELVHVKIPAGKRCGFVQFAERACAEQALSLLNGTQIGSQNVRLSWGRSPSNKQAPSSDQSQWSGGGGGGGGGAYYGYGQGGGGGYEGYGSYGQQPQQDPNMYYGGGYPGYGNYQQPQQ
ncbi:polyadenylate-binding protein RBP45-like isoform X2 [Impatiens glandulifera]|uniref:polyadenylate-binding protein RBP45-like isoform X2 n=1 Tax=Impatiens glandulifera TaxID=253017 RepID=UPI001FB17CD5|nr:polyadenylate-binding protein RBP45-like isoform X2 [Impatiens glandulifera]